MPKILLLINDDSEVASLIQDSLSDEGFDVLLASDKESVIEIISNNTDISMLIFDLMVPKITGFNIYKKLKKSVNCPILYVGVENKFLDKVLGLDINSNNYIKKPFSIEDLISKIKINLQVK